MSVVDAICIAILQKGETGDLFKLCPEMALGGKTQISRNFNIGVLRVGEQIFGAFYFFPENITGQGDSLIFFKKLG